MLIQPTKEKQIEDQQRTLRIQQSESRIGITIKNIKARVYMIVANENIKIKATQLIPLFADKGIASPPISFKNGKSIKKTEVRYYSDEERDEAELILNILKQNCSSDAINPNPVKVVGIARHRH